MITESRADFARRMGWNRSSVTRAVKDGRVVLEGDRVNVEASLKKIEALASPDAHHRAHAQQLEEARAVKITFGGAGDAPDIRRAAAEGARQALAQAGEGAPSIEGIEALNLRLKRAEADKREHEAESARMDREERAGNLIKREDVEFALDDFAATLRSLMENFADRLAPVVHPLQSMEETHAALAEAANDVLQTMSDSLLSQSRYRVESVVVRKKEYVNEHIPQSDPPIENHIAPPMENSIKRKKAAPSMTRAEFSGALNVNPRAGHRHLSDEIPE